MHERLRPGAIDFHPAGKGDVSRMDAHPAEDGIRDLMIAMARVWRNAMSPDKEARQEEDCTPHLRGSFTGHDGVNIRHRMETAISRDSTPMPSWLNIWKATKPMYKAYPIF